MTTTYDQLTILYKRLTAPDCALAIAITGKVYRNERPGGLLEDVVVNSLPVNTAQVQLGTANVNIYVADIKLNGRYVANEARLNELTKLAYQVLDEIYDAEYTMHVSSQDTFDEPDIKMHYSNLRIEFQHYERLQNA